MILSKAEINDQQVLKALSDYITIAQDPLITVKSGANGVEAYDLEAVILTEFLNQIRGTVKVKGGADFKGIMGLAERTVTDLFLPDGVYGLWSRDSPNPEEKGTFPSSNMYGVHPFYMARASDDSWFGVFTAVAAAEDWNVTNDA